MAEILLPDCQFPRLSDGATCRDIHAETLCQACTARVQVAALRTRLESAEAARRDAQESRFAVIIQNEELGADLADLRARVESAEAALERCVSLADPGDVADADYCAACANVQFVARAALGAAGEENTNE